MNGTVGSELEKVRVLEGVGGAVVKRPDADRAVKGETVGLVKRETVGMAEPEGENEESPGRGGLGDQMDPAQVLNHSLMSAWGASDVAADKDKVKQEVEEPAVVDQDEDEREKAEEEERARIRFRKLSKRDKEMERKKQRRLKRASESEI